MNPGLSHHRLSSLAPERLRSYRTARFQGHQLAVELTLLPEADQGLITETYRLLRQLQGLLETTESTETKANRLSAFLDSSEWKRWEASFPQLGRETPEGLRQYRRVIHDIKGGAMTSLLMRLEFWKSNPGREKELQQIRLRVFDQCKILRGTLPALDPENYQRDATYNRHNMEMLIGKWGREFFSKQGTCQLLLDNHFHGDVSERCLEFSALERSLYNLLNNAGTHSSKRIVHLAILPLGEPPDGNIRFVVSNPITETQSLRLKKAFGDEPGKLFASEFSTTGGGMGLGICAEIVCNAYGLQSVDQALVEGHLGVEISEEGTDFLVWFHWPMVDD